jgi:hypothetical protein
VWAFGGNDTGLGAIHWDGHAWAKEVVAPDLGFSPSHGTLVAAAWGSGRDDVWVVASVTGPTGVPQSTELLPQSTFLHWDGRAWSRDTSLDAQVVTGMARPGPRALRVPMWAISFGTEPR